MSSKINKGKMVYATSLAFIFILNLAFVLCPSALAEGGREIAEGDFDPLTNGGAFILSGDEDVSIAGGDAAGLFRPSTQTWYFNYDNADGSEYSFVWGDSTDIPVVGDWNGDGKDEVGLYRPSTRRWYFNYDNTGGSEYSFVWGDGTDIPVVGDWNGDGKDTAGLFRPSNR